MYLPWIAINLGTASSKRWRLNRVHLICFNLHIIFDLIYIEYMKTFTDSRGAVAYIAGQVLTKTSFGTLGTSVVEQLLQKETDGDLKLALDAVNASIDILQT